jgi:hypothetical protein
VLRVFPCVFLFILVLLSLIKLFGKSYYLLLYFVGPLLLGAIPYVLVHGFSAVSSIIHTHTHTHTHRTLTVVKALNLIHIYYIMKKYFI